MRAIISFRTRLKNKENETRQELRDALREILKKAYFRPVSPIIPRGELNHYEATISAADLAQTLHEFWTTVNTPPNLDAVLDHFSMLCDAPEKGAQGESAAQGPPTEQ